MKLDERYLYRLVDSARRILKHAEWLQELNDPQFIVEHDLKESTQNYLISDTLEDIATERKFFDEWFNNLPEDMTDE